LIFDTVITHNGDEPLKKTRNVSLLQIAQTGSGTKPASYSMGIESFFPGGKAAEVWYDHSASSADIKNEWSCSATPPICLQGVRMDNLTFSTYPYMPCNISSFSSALCTVQSPLARIRFLKIPTNALECSDGTDIFRPFMWPYSEWYEQEYNYNYLSESMYSCSFSGAIRVHSPSIAAAQTHICSRP